MRKRRKEEPRSPDLSLGKARVALQPTEAHLLLTFLVLLLFSSSGAVTGHTGELLRLLPYILKERGVIGRATPVDPRVRRAEKEAIARVVRVSAHLHAFRPADPRVGNPRVDGSSDQSIWRPDPALIKRSSGVILATRAPLTRGSAVPANRATWIAHHGGHHWHHGAIFGVFHSIQCNLT